ncbi:MAG TPA: hypothetical protein VEG65_00835 [Candidatus Bathyarchaeia archaeon]|nr:hypothetical protein [Candidatus Bathyarchaeia archaeon]
MKKDKVIQTFLEKIVSLQGLEIFERLSHDELTDQELADQGGYDLPTVRKTLLTLYEHHLASYELEHDKESKRWSYRWHVDYADVERRITDDALRLVRTLERWLDEERNSVYYTCDNHCSRYSFEMASGPECGYAFVCPVCEHSLYYDDTTVLTDAVQGKIDELKTNAHAIFYPENVSFFELAQTAEG